MLFGVVAVVSGVGCFCYFIGRFADNKSLFLSFIVVCASIGFTLFLLMMVCDNAPYLASFGWLLLNCFVGSWFHRASGGKSNGFLLMFVVSMATVLLSFFVLAFSTFFTPFFSKFALDDKNLLDVDMGLIFAYACFTAPMATVFFLRLFQIMKPRPGIDRHLNDGDEPM